MKQSLYEVHARLCHVFSNPARLELLDLLRGGPLSVSELTKKAGLGQANVSQHLGVMKREGIVFSERCGQRVFYRLFSPKIIAAFDLIREGLSERLKQEEKILKTGKR